MTEDEYWENDKSVIRKGLTCGNYKKALKEKFKKDNNIENEKELTNKFEEYYDQKYKELKSKAKIQSFPK